MLVADGADNACFTEATFFLLCSAAAPSEIIRKQTVGPLTMRLVKRKITPSPNGSQPAKVSRLKRPNDRNCAHARLDCAQQNLVTARECYATARASLKESKEALQNLRKSDANAFDVESAERDVLIAHKEVETTLDGVSTAQQILATAHRFLEKRKGNMSALAAKTAVATGTKTKKKRDRL